MSTDNLQHSVSVDGIHSELVGEGENFVCKDGVYSHLKIILINLKTTQPCMTSTMQRRTLHG